MGQVESAVFTKSVLIRMRSNSCKLKGKELKEI